MLEEKRPKVGVGVMIFREGKVLLGRRHDNPINAGSKLNGAGTWTMPGGGLEFGESFEMAAKREVKEETGIDIENIKLISINEDMNDNAHFVTLGFYSDKFKGEAKIMEPDQIVEWNWFNLHNLPNPLYLPSKKLLNNFNQNKFYLEDNK
ncbi:MAG: NUDIX domain-containing protein [Nanoarchaeota archaeon]|nr:NUDIX domain-containing protein [Nanoarchaeota archaeon]